MYISQTIAYWCTRFPFHKSLIRHCGAYHNKHKPYKLYDCTLKNNDDATIRKTIVGKNGLKTCTGKCIKIKALNNDFVLDCGFVEE